MRKGLGKGGGRGYYNLVPNDKHIHRLSAQGISTATAQVPKYAQDLAKLSLGVAENIPPISGVPVGVIVRASEYVPLSSAWSLRRMAQGKRPLFAKGEKQWVIVFEDGSRVLVEAEGRDRAIMKARQKQSDENRYDFAKRRLSGGRVINAYSLNAKETPEIIILKPKEFNKKFHKEYHKGMIGEATTRISDKGKVKIYLKDTGDDQQTDLNLKHELWELKEWKKLVKKGVDPKKATILAHNKNPFMTDENPLYAKGLGQDKRWVIKFEGGYVIVVDAPNKTNALKKAKKELRKQRRESQNYEKWERKEANIVLKNPNVYSKPLSEASDEVVSSSPYTISGKGTGASPDKVMKVAKKLEKTLFPDAIQVEIAGSVRRKEPDPQDLDIVVIPKDREQFTHKVEKMASEVKASGDKQIFAIIDGVETDFFFSTKDDFGANLLTRTGSAGNNIGLRMIAKKQGLKLSQYGLFDRVTGKRLAGKTEEDIYHALGRNWKPPELRK